MSTVLRLCRNDEADKSGSHYWNSKTGLRTSPPKKMQFTPEATCPECMAAVRAQSLPDHPVIEHGSKKKKAEDGLEALKFPYNESLGGEEAPDHGAIDRALRLRMLRNDEKMVFGYCDDFFDPKNRSFRTQSRKAFKQFVDLWSRWLPGHASNDPAYEAKQDRKDDVSQSFRLGTDAAADDLLEEATPYREDGNPFPDGSVILLTKVFDGKRKGHTKHMFGKNMDDEFLPTHSAVLIACNAELIPFICIDLFFENQSNGETTRIVCQHPVPPSKPGGKMTAKQVLNIYADAFLSYSPSRHHLIHMERM